MIKLIAMVLFTFVLFKTNAQQIEVGFSTGTGYVYIIENIDSKADLDYKNPIILVTSLKYTPKDSFFGIKFKYQHINTILTGKNWQKIDFQGLILDEINGNIENNFFIFLLEHFYKKNKISIGYNFGLGYSKERINFDEKGKYHIDNEYVILNLGSNFKYELSQKIDLCFEPIFLWNDPINSLYSNRYRLGGEDINFLFQVGLNYKIK
jgi:hypothetical protein